MRLSFDEIKSISVGAVAIEEKNDGIHFLKCTPAQTSAWYALSDILGERSLSTTGIRLDFVTDSKSFSFGSSSGKCYELFVDSEFVGAIVPAENDSQKINYSVKLSDACGKEKNEYRVTVVFPSHNAPGVLTYVELDDGSYFKHCEYSSKLLFIGDSITQGWNSGRDSLSYAYRVSAYFDANSVINGIGGAFYEESTFEKIDFDPDTVIVAYGTNDWNRCGRDPEKILSHACGYMDLLKAAYADKRVFVISPIWRRLSKPEARVRFGEYRRAIADEAQKHGFIHVDGSLLVPPVNDLYTDGLHPNGVGFSLFAENLIEIMKEFV